MKINYEDSVINHNLKKKNNNNRLKGLVFWFWFFSLLHEIQYSTDCEYFIHLWLKVVSLLCEIFVLFCFVQKQNESHGRLKDSHPKRLRVVHVLGGSLAPKAAVR